jgi:benzil reductase ((S)-benzoin forming)
MSDTTIWITGATDGIGEALAKTAPWQGARIINLSRRQHPDYETVLFDLTKPSTWKKVRQHLNKELGAFKGRRAIFIQNAYHSDTHGTIGSIESERYQEGVLANVAAPLALGEMFLSAVRPGYEAGLIMMSAGAAAFRLEMLSAYSAGKAAIEQWVQVVNKELRAKPDPKPWVVAMRPGGVATAPVLRAAAMTDESAPNAAHIRANIKNRLTPDQAAKRIWEQVPPPRGVSVISFGAPPTDPDMQFGGDQIRQVDVPGWKLVYR